MLKLKLQLFGHVMQRADLLENTLLFGKTEDVRRRGKWKHCVLGSKITVNCDRSHEIKYMFLGRKAMTNLDSI